MDFQRLFHQFILTSRRFIFHHGPEHGPSHGSYNESPQQKSVERLKRKPGIPVDVEVRESLSPKEEKEILKPPFEHVRSFKQDPERKVSPQRMNDFFSGKSDEVGQIWRMLSVPRRMQYQLIQEPNLELKQRQFLRMDKHRAEIMANYQNDKQGYAKMLSTPGGRMKTVPVLALPGKKETVHELNTPKPVFFLGSEHISDNALFQKAEVHAIGGANDPVSALQAFEKQVAKSPDGQLKDATVVLNFDAKMFVSGMSLDQMIASTKELLHKIQEKGMKTVMITPLNVWMHDYSRLGGKYKLQGERGAEEAVEIRKKYMDFLALSYQEGKIGSLVDAASAMNKQLRDESGKLKPVYYSDPNDLNKGLNAEGFSKIAAGIVDGVNFAHGEHTGRTNADGEIHYYGTGDSYGENITGQATRGEKPKTVELIPGHEDMQSIAKLPKEVRKALWRLSDLHMAADLGLAKISEDRMKYEITTTQSLINALEDPVVKEFAHVELMRQKASIYYMYAWQALRNGDFQESLQRITTARQENTDFLAWQKTPMFAVRLNRLERLAKSRTKIGETVKVDPVHRGAQVPRSMYEVATEHQH